LGWRPDAQQCQPVCLAPASPDAIADWQAKTGTTGRADPSPDEPDIGKELTWTVEEFFQLL
jgi:hypothetical protein